MPASNDVRMGEDSPTPGVLYGTDYAAAWLDASGAYAKGNR
jgi:hypothetical protein